MNIGETKRVSHPVENDSMPSYPKLTPPESLGAAIVPLGSISEEAFNIFLRAVSTPRSFSLTQAQVKALRERLPDLASTLPFTLGALSYLHLQIETLGDVDDKFHQIITKLVDDLEIAGKSLDERKTIETRLELLLRKNVANSRFKKIQRLRSGFIPNATSFRSMVDLRPDFGDKDEVNYRGLLKIIQFRVMTDSSNPAEKELIFQLSEEALGELSKAIERAQKKLSALNEEPSISSQFIEIES
jgi:hypothetical protein